MTTLQTLPPRPLTAKEIKALDDSEKFVGVAPINAIFEPEYAAGFVISLILLTDHRVVAAQYDIEERSWTTRYERDAETHEEREEAYSEAEAILEEAADDLESEGAVSDVVDESSEDGVNQALRNAEDLGEILVQHYEDAT